jgi:hypothetical protein
MDWKPIDDDHDTADDYNCRKCEHEIRQEVSDEFRALVEKLTHERDGAEIRIADCVRWEVQAGIEKERAERAEAALAKVEDILGEANGTHAEYRKGAAVASAEVARDRLAYLEELHRMACVEAEKRAERAAKAEAERDEARSMFCHVDTNNHDRKTPRDVCLATWPDAADRLFPDGGGK